jgi:hypothetical protein
MAEVSNKSRALPRINWGGNRVAAAAEHTNFITVFVAEQYRYGYSA